MEIDLRQYTKTNISKKRRSSEGTYQFLDKFQGIHSASKEWSSKKKQNFFHNLSILLSSGVDLSMSINVMLESTSSNSEKKVLETILRSLMKGDTFAECLKNTDKFSEYEYHCIRIGEERSRILGILTELSSYHSNRIAQKRRILSAFSYPIIVMITAFAAMSFMLAYIVPMFQDIFTRFNKELPSITLFVISLSENISSIVLVLVLIIVGLTIFHYIYLKEIWYQRILSKTILSIPVLGKLICRIQLARFCLIMELLLSAKTNIIESLKLSKPILKLYHFKYAIGEVSQNVLTGKSLNESMKQFKVFDARMIALIKVAEEVNQLEEVFKQLKDQYNKDVEYQSGILNSVLEPILILFIGLFVGLILIAMYLPIFNISSSIM